MVRKYSIENPASAGRRHPRRPGFTNTFPVGRGRKLGRPRRLWIGTKASKIQDGEDVDILRSPVVNIQLHFEILIIQIS